MHHYFLVLRSTAGKGLEIMDSEGLHVTKKSRL